MDPELWRRRASLSPADETAYDAPMPTRATGFFLFLPVPLVLFLLTRAPLGTRASLGVSVPLMLTHRLYARPWALGRADRRCLWCGADLPPDAGSSCPELAVAEPSGRATWRACREAHAVPVRRVLAWAERRRSFLAVGIVGTLGLFLLWSAASALVGPGRGVLGLSFDDAVAFFRLGIAAAVLPLGWLAARTSSAAVGPLRSPFPLHVPALVGLRTVLWLFRLVGLLWLAQGTLQLVGRIAVLG